MILEKRLKEYLPSFEATACRLRKFMPGCFHPLVEIDVDDHRICLSINQKNAFLTIHCPSRSPRSYSHKWLDWFLFDQAAIEFRGISPTWWEKNKQAVHDLMLLIESHIGCGMITNQSAAQVLDRHGLEYTLCREDLVSKTICIWSEGYFISLHAAFKKMGIGGRGHAAPEYWDNWFRFDETDIEFRKIELDWWKKHKPALQELVQLLEAATPGPVNCMPDICA
ncbi:MAG: hypothetical protein KDA77_13485 [Planctomycetaceae bacterium]|nr:hypothetical protein [Planctomycetaceae bacterium]